MLWATLGLVGLACLLSWALWVDLRWMLVIRQSVSVGMAQEDVTARMGPPTNVWVLKGPLGRPARLMHRWRLGVTRDDVVGLGWWLHPWDVYVYYGRDGKVLCVTARDP